MTEPDVTLTDYALMLLCAGFAFQLSKRRFTTPPLQRLWILFFISVAVASLTGGTVHGFFLDESSLGYRLLWPLTLLAIGVTASTAWMIAGFFAFGRKALQSSMVFAVFCFLLYALVVLTYSQSFATVIFNYLPPMILLLFASVKEYRRTQLRSFLWIAGGIGISFVGAYFQQAQIALHPQYFNHNSTYHLIQALGLYALFYGAKGLEKFEATT